VKRDVRSVVLEGSIILAAAVVVCRKARASA
jgi:hypothetical protein